MPGHPPRWEERGGPGGSIPAEVPRRTELPSSKRDAVPDRAGDSHAAEAGWDVSATLMEPVDHRADLVGHDEGAEAPGGHRLSHDDLRAHLAQPVQVGREQPRRNRGGSNSTQACFPLELDDGLARRERQALLSQLPHRIGATKAATHSSWSLNSPWHPTSVRSTSSQTRRRSPVISTVDRSCCSPPSTARPVRALASRTRPRSACRSPAVPVRHPQSPSPKRTCAPTRCLVPGVSGFLVVLPRRCQRP
jgi:hypothetical protein